MKNQSNWMHSYPSAFLLLRLATPGTSCSLFMSPIHLISRHTLRLLSPVIYFAGFIPSASLNALANIVCLLQFLNNAFSFVKCGLVFDLDKHFSFNFYY
jgi:hypothetical protein